MRRPVWFWALWLTALLTGCDRQPSATPTHESGSRPRIVALAPAISRTLTDAGAAEYLVGRHAFDPWTDQRLPICGDQAGIDYEALLRVQPTHVLLQWGERELPSRLERLARQHGWTVKSYPFLKLEDVLASAREIQRTWRSAAGSAQPAPDPIARMQAVFSRRANIDAARVGRVLLLYGTSPAGALGPGSYHQQMLVSLGATPAITEGSPFITLDREDLLHMAPDAIILIQPRWPGIPESPDAHEPAMLRARLGKIAKLPIPAVKSGRIALIDDPMALVPGTNLVDVARAMADILERWSAPGAKTD